MPNIKVIIVDDEILAIEYIRGLVDWNSLGFTIVTTQTQPLKVAESIRKTQPDLIIIDIVMPGMDGLELSKRLLQEFPNLKIILLTSYKDFEYAQTAVKLGVYNYLVKHELDAQHLQEELQRLKVAMYAERQKQQNELEALLLHWFRGEQLHQLTPLQPHLNWHKQWQLILLKADTQFSWFESSADEQDFYWRDTAFQQEQLADASQQRLLAIPIQQRMILLLYGITDVVSIKKQKELLETELLVAKNIASTMSSSTFSSLLVSQINKVEEIPLIINIIYEKLASSFFYGKEVIFRFEPEASVQPVLQSEADSSSEVYQEEFDLIKQFLQENRYEDSSQAISSLLGRLRQSNDMTILRKVCLELYNLLNRQAIRVMGSSLSSQWEQGEMDKPYFNQFDALHNWFATVIARFTEINKEQKSLSRKVSKAVEYIETHYSDLEFNNDQLATELNISSDHLRHLFKEELGVTLHDKLTEIRLQHAKRLLREGKLKVYQIAERVGYRESRYFSQVFRKHIGITPQEFMDKAR